MRKVILYIAISQDNFIADIDGKVDWLPQPKNDVELEAIGYKNIMSRIDTIVMGSRSYQQILSFGDWEWSDRQTYVFTSKKLESDKSYISITHDSPLEFMNKMKEYKSNKDIWLLGGSQLAMSFEQKDLIDEVILTIVPKALGAGISLGLTLENFDLISEKSLIDGMIQKTYLRKG